MDVPYLKEAMQFLLTTNEGKYIIVMLILAFIGYIYLFQRTGNDPFETFHRD